MSQVNFKFSNEGLPVILEKADPAQLEGVVHGRVIGPATPDDIETHLRRTRSATERGKIVAARAQRREAITHILSDLNRHGETHTRRQAVAIYHQSLNPQHTQ